MTDQLELDRILDAFFVAGPEELADRVIDAALDQVDHTPQRHAVRLPRRFLDMPMLSRAAAAAVVGVLVVGGTFYLLKPGQAAIGGPGVTASPGTPAATATATAAPSAASAPASPHASSVPGPMGDGRQIQTQTTLADGRVLIAGGYDANDAPLASAVLYDPKTNRFTQTGAMAWARGMFTATLLSDGRVLVAGGGYASWVGVQGASFLASAELYDPKTGTFSPTGSMSTPREDHTATRLLDGRVLIVGGDDRSTHGTATAEIYDPGTGTFSPTGSMTTARGFHTATLLLDGRVLIAGGEGAAWTPSLDLASAEIYDPKTGTFRATGSMSTARTFHAAAPFTDGRVLMTGGTDGGVDLASAEIYDPKTGAFSATDSMFSPRVYHTATRLADGRVLIVGGGSDYTGGDFLSTAGLYDPGTGRFTATGSLATARTYHAASLLADGRVLVTGGYGKVAPLASGEIYDPRTGSFKPAG